MLTRYFDESRAIVERYSGVIDKFIGDAVMAVWGAVEAHEDDAERAVRAALELVDMASAIGAEIGVPELRLRAGVLTGETSVGPGGNDRGLVVGDLVNTASRLQSIAEPGSVFIGAPTFELVKGVVDCTSKGSHDLKGKAEPVTVYRAERIVAGHGGRRRAETVEPPFVGREDELRVLKDQLHAVGRERRSRLVSVVGDGGIGKTRLAWEFFKYIDGLPEDTYWHQGRSPSYGEGLTLWSLGEMVRQRCGIAETDEAPKSRMKLRTALAEYVADEEERRWLDPWLSGLLGLDAMPEGDRAELVFEDLHWADQGVVDFIEELLERSQHHPILVITLARPELLERHPGWGAGRFAAAAIRLPPLGGDAMSALVTGMVPGIPEQAVATVVRHAAGVPLYAVEFVRMLVASGDVVREGDRFRLTGDLTELSVPDSLQAVIGARLDRLDADERSLVQDAAVLGQTFPLEGLMALRGGGADDIAREMQELVRKELFELNDDPRSPERGQYSFVQSVVREVAYGRLSRADRRVAHLRVAEYFEGLDEPELAAAVASHLLAARDAGADDDGLVARALAALGGAADRAAALHSYGQVLSLSEQAAAIAETDRDRAPFWERATVACGMLADTDGVIAFGAKARAHAESVGDQADRMRAARLTASALGGQFRSGEALAILRPVFEDMDETDRSEEAVRFLAEMGRSLMLNGLNAEAVDVCDRALAEAERHVMMPTIVDAVITKGTALGNAGRRQEAIVLLRGATDLAEDHDLTRLIVRATNNLSVILQDIDHEAARIAGDRGLALVERVGDIGWRYQKANSDASYLAMGGDLEGSLEAANRYAGDDLPAFWDRAFALRRHFVRMFRGEAEAPADLIETVEPWLSGDDPQLLAMVLLIRAEVHLVEGRYAEAQADIAKVTTEFPDVHVMWALITMARIAISTGDPGEIDRAGAVLAEHGVPGRLMTAVSSLLDGAAAAMVDDRSAAVDGFVTAIDLFDRVDPGTPAVEARAYFASLVGTEEPAAAAAAEVVREWVQERGYGMFRNRFPELFSTAVERTETA
jgi:tetratricopeptide (TPR) repeat protein